MLDANWFGFHIGTNFFKDFAKEKAGKCSKCRIICRAVTKKYYTEELKKNRELIQAERDKYEKLTEQKMLPMDTVLNNIIREYYEVRKYRMETIWIYSDKTRLDWHDAPVVTRKCNQPVVSLKLRWDNGAGFLTVYTPYCLRSIKAYTVLATDNNNFFMREWKFFGFNASIKTSTIISWL